MRRRGLGWSLLGAIAGLLLDGALSRATAANVEYAERDACKDCHEQKWNEFEKTSHGFEGDKRTPMSTKGCQSCHGPAQAHVDSMGKVPVINLTSKSTLKPAKKAEICLQCHENTPKLGNWHGSTHDVRGKTCTDCHSIHSGNDKNLREATVMDTCLNCHKEMRSELARASHHPIREGKLTCVDCHNPHGTQTDKMISANTVNEKCWSCHAEHRGPFLWDHAPVRENCLNCHRPHGSSHEKLLAGDKPQLCTRCHSISRHPGTFRGLVQDPANPARTEAGQSPYWAVIPSGAGAGVPFPHTGVGVQGWYRG